MKAAWLFILTVPVLLFGASGKESKSGPAAGGFVRPDKAAEAKAETYEKSTAGPEEEKARPSEENDTRSELRALVYANVEASRQEDLETYMYTLHRDAPHYEATRELMEKTFDKYELEYKLTNVSVTAVSGNTARVSFTQSTRKLAGPEFKPNRVTGVHVLRKEDKRWKIFSTRINEIKKDKTE
ncbi:MAG: nuclear transport factor 2 family protein [bacterium]